MDFAQYINRANFKFDVPKRKKLAEHIVPRYAAKVEHKLGEELAKIGAVHFTWDNWTSMGHENYIVLTGHFITQKWKMVERVLEFKHYKEGHDQHSLR